MTQYDYKLPCGAGEALGLSVQVTEPYGGSAFTELQRMSGEKKTTQIMLNFFNMDI